MYIKNLNPNKTLKESFRIEKMCTVTSVEIYVDKVEITEFCFAIFVVQGEKKISILPCNMPLLNVFNEKKVKNVLWDLILKDLVHESMH